jgi:NADH:ubiquinone oxidoreductase subunit 4 (subunit M)
MLYRSLLSVGWGGMAALAMAAAAAGVLPALSAIGSPPPLPLRGARAALAVVLIALIVILGLYPQPCFDTAREGLSSLQRITSGAPKVSSIEIFGRQQ